MTYIIVGDASNGTLWEGSEFNSPVNDISGQLEGGMPQVPLHNSPNDRSLQYMPDANWYGTDEFRFKVNDGTSDSNISTVTITVNPVSDKPVITQPNISYTTDEDTPITVWMEQATDVDTPAGSLFYHPPISLPTNGTLIIWT